MMLYPLRLVAVGRIQPSYSACKIGRRNLLPILLQHPAALPHFGIPLADLADRLGSRNVIYLLLFSFSFVEHRFFSCSFYRALRKGLFAIRYVRRDHVA
jgi:hypothetical protein